MTLQPLFATTSDTVVQVVDGGTIGTQARRSGAVVAESNSIIDWGAAGSQWVLTYTCLDASPVHRILELVAPPNGPTPYPTPPPGVSFMDPPKTKLMTKHHAAQKSAPIFPSNSVDKNPCDAVVVFWGGNPIQAYARTDAQINGRPIYKLAQDYYDKNTMSPVPKYLYYSPENSGGVESHPLPHRVHAASHINAHSPLSAKTWAWRTGTSPGAPFPLNGHESTLEPRNSYLWLRVIDQAPSASQIVQPWQWWDNSNKRQPGASLRPQMNNRDSALKAQHMNVWRVDHGSSLRVRVYLNSTRWCSAEQ